MVAFYAVAVCFEPTGFAQSADGQSHQPEHPFVPGRLLVKFKEGVSAEAGRGVLSANQARSTRVMEGIGVHVVELPAQANERAFIEILKGQPEVEFAELDEILTPQAVVPNDTYFGMEMYPSWIKLTDAWSTTTGSSAITVAVIDTGIFPIHADLSAKLVSGWNFFDNNSNTSDVTGHGTWAAGVIAPSANNGFGVAGVCWGCKVMPLRVADLAGNATVSNIANGITWAADHGAKIANLGYAATANSTVSSAAQYLWNRGGITVAPSGNNGTFDSSPDNPYILTVGGTDAWSDAIWPSSNTGNNIDLTAPDFSGYTTVNGGGYGADNSGTCISAAIVSGVAALVWSVNPNLTPTDVTGILQQSADDKGAAGRDSTYGWGRVNALRAVTMASSGGTKTNTSTTLISSLNPSTSGQPVTFTATVSPSAAAGTVMFYDGATALGTGTLAGGIATLSTSSLSVGSHSITASYAGNSSYNGSTSAALTQTVNTASLIGTSTALISSLNPSTSGQIVTFTATVSPSAATGTVTFYDGATALGTGTLAGGMATFTTSSLSIGSHSITARYGGNSSYNSSTSAALTQTINTASKTNTSTTLTSSLNPSTSGQSVTFTATVSPSAATGTVTFLDGAATIGSGTVVSGRATFSTASLAVGSHSIKATYNGDANYNGSTSATLTQSVNGTTDTYAPTAPTNLRDAPPSSFQVPLMWTASTDNIGVAGYKLFRQQLTKGPKGSSTQIGTSTITSYADGTVKSGVTYAYTVYAYDAAGNVSAASNTFTVLVP